MNTEKIEIRARYQETDQMGVVYYSNYLVWFEIARTDYFRKRGVVYKELEERDKIYLPVVEACCRYRAPIRYDDLVTVETKLTEASKSRLTFEYEVKKEAKVTTTGYTKHVFVNGSGKPIPIPENIKSSLVGRR
ncbi:MAG: thioesterase family protein [Candidatus Omnitrophota bacterium]